MPRFQPDPDESPFLVPPTRLPPTAVGLAMLPPPVPPRGAPARSGAGVRARILLTLAGAGFLAGGIALATISLWLLPVTFVAGRLGAEGLVAGLFDRGLRGLLLVRVVAPNHID